MHKPREAHAVHHAMGEENRGKWQGASGKRRGFGPWTLDLGLLCAAQSQQSQRGDHGDHKQAKGELEAAFAKLALANGLITTETGL